MHDISATRGITGFVVAIFLQEFEGSALVTMRARAAPIVVNTWRKIFQNTRAEYETHSIFPVRYRVSPLLSSSSAGLYSTYLSGSRESRGDTVTTERGQSTELANPSLSRQRVCAQRESGELSQPGRFYNPGYERNESGAGDQRPGEGRWEGGPAGY